MSRDTPILIAIILLFIFLFILLDMTYKTMDTLEGLQQVTHNHVDNTRRIQSHVKELQDIILDNQERIIKLEEELNGRE